MKDYFTAKPVHLDGLCLISAAPKVPLIATYGIDNYVNIINPETDEEQRHELMNSEMFTAMALSPDGSHIFFGNSFLKQLNNHRFSSMISKRKKSKKLDSR